MVTKFIEPWVLFPGHLIVLLLLLGLLSLRLARRVRRLNEYTIPMDALEGTHADGEVRRTVATARRLAIVLLASSVVLFVVSTDVVSNALMGSLESSVAPATPEDLSQAEAVVVLGGGVVWRSPAEETLEHLPGGDGTTTESRTDNVPHYDASRNAVRPSALTSEAESRLVYGLRLARRLEIPMVVSGGRVFTAGAIPAEAEVAYRLAVDIADGEVSVLKETESRTTAENAAYTARDFPFSRVAVVTSAYHMRRSLLAFRAAGLEPLAAPAAFRSDARPFHLYRLMPTSGALEDSAVVLRERIGYLWYRLRGSS